jgi:hypothetical protein
VALCFGLTLAACDEDGTRAPNREAPSAAGASAAHASPLPAHVVRVRATDKGFEPAEIHLKQGTPGALELTRVTDSDCVSAVRMPWMKDAVDLPRDKPVRIDVDTSKAGAFVYACWMNMVFGRVVIDP